MRGQGQGRDRRTLLGSALGVLCPTPLPTASHRLPGQVAEYTVSCYKST